MRGSSRKLMFALIKKKKKLVCRINDKQIQTM